MAKPKTYSDKRSFDVTPEPPPNVEGNVDPGAAPAGDSFVIHQHHARRLHFDLRLEMMNGDTPVLVSWAVPRNLPLKTGEAHLAVHVEDHPFEYGKFSGTIPAGEYGAGEVRIFDEGRYEVLEQEPGKLTFRLDGTRMKGVWHLFRPSKRNGDDDKNWLVRLRQLERDDPETPPALDPMKATLAAEPFDDDRWIFEPKWDGVRCLAVCAMEQTQLVSRTRKDMSTTYPELARLHERLVSIDAVVDGEIVAMHEGRPSFERLQSRINLHNPRDIERTMKSIPVTFIAFDLIYLDGRSLISLPIEERKDLLVEAVVPSNAVQVSPHVPGSGMALYEAAVERRLEGMVAKKLGSPYRPGRRAKDWIKIKAVQDAEVVIGGWQRGEGSRASTFGSLLVGAYEDGELRFVGAVGTGFGEQMLESLMPRLNELATDDCPFSLDPTGTSGGPFGKPVRDPRWVKPELVAKVEFRELTSVGRLRAPSFKGLDPSKEPRDCTFADLELLG